ncbi:MAG: hypothetical protein OEV33_01670 [Armatimonadota bacterium]|nr:hypothetical protein [Armatimonadota bacterium]
MRRLVLLAVVLGAATIGLLRAESVQVVKHTVWVVPWDHQGLVNVQPGDVIEVWTRPLPVIPENLESRFRASKEGGGVELVGETLPHKEGTMERLFFFKAFDPGPATLKVELVNAEGEVREAWSYAVEVAALRD